MEEAAATAVLVENVLENAMAVALVEMVVMLVEKAAAVAAFVIEKVAVVLLEVCRQKVNTFI